MTRFTTAMLLLGGLAGLAAGASAAPIDVPTTVVRFHSDVLATDSGTRALYSRLARAAEQVCPQQYPLASEVVLKCRQEALTGAVNEIHNQRLAAHASRMSTSG